MREETDQVVSENVLFPSSEFGLVRIYSAVGSC